MFYWKEEENCFTHNCKTLWSVCVCVFLQNRIVDGTQKFPAAVHSSLWNSLIIERMYAPLLGTVSHFKHSACSAWGRLLRTLPSVVGGNISVLENASVNFLSLT